MERLLGVAKSDAGDPPPYTAVHLRMGWLIGEEGAVERHGNELDSTLATITFAKALSQQYGFPTPVVFVTDKRTLRYFIALDNVKGVVSPTQVEAVHIDTFRSDNPMHQRAWIRTHLATFVEFALLAKAKCLIVSQSGFSIAAMWMGGNYDDCYYTVQDTQQASKARMEEALHLWQRARALP